MANLEDLKRKIMKLSPDERRVFGQWLAEYDPEQRKRDSVADESVSEDEGEPAASRQQFLDRKGSIQTGPGDVAEDIRRWRDGEAADAASATGHDEETKP